jgi:type IV secretory pathway TrbF-like protein
VEPNTVTSNLTQAYEFLRGPAIERFTTEIINDRKPIERSKKDLTYRVSVSVISTNVLTDGRALVRFKTKETARNLDKPIEATWALNIQTSFDPPKTEEEIFKNPIGIYIIDFSLAREFQ